MDIHRLRFVDYTPHTVTALAFSHTESSPELRLAVGRSNGDIEIWNPRHNWTHELTLPGARGRAVEGLVWAGEEPRLFLIGGSTYVTEWDLKICRPRASYDCNAGVVWCIDANPKGDTLSVGCDDGSVVLVDISGGVMEHLLICQRQDQRVLGIRWYGNDLLIGGCADGRVRCWAAAGERRGRIVGSMKVDNSKTESTLVWSIVALPERQQFATGDLTGSVKFWDVNTFTLVQTFSVHEADVLCLVRDSTSSRVFLAGIDRRIHQFGWWERTWLHNGNRLLHLNDVRALAMYDLDGQSLLVSAGVERLIIVQLGANLQGSYKKIAMSQQRSNIATCAEGRLVALFQDQTVKIWRLEDDRPRLVCKLSLAEDDNIVSAGLGAPDEGVSVLAVATINSVKIFELTEAGHKLHVRKLRDEAFDSLAGGAKNVWVHDRKLLVHTPEDELYKFTVGENTVDLDDEIETVGSSAASKLEYSNCIRGVAVASDFSKVVVSRFNNRVEVLPLDGTPGHVLATLSTPVHMLDFTAQNTVVVLSADNKVYEFAMQGKLLTPWSQRNSEVMPLPFLKMDDKAQGMFSEGQRVWIYGSRWLAFFDLTLNLSVPKEYIQKARKRNRDGLSIRDGDSEEVPRTVYGREADDEDSEYLERKMPFWITQKYRPILKVTSWGKEEIAVVERDLFALPTAAAFEVPQIRM